MTTHKSFKRLVRARMAKTGESYTAARRSLLEPVEQATATSTVPGQAHQPTLATSDAEIQRRTGRGWEEWFDLLDAWGAGDRTHREIARWVAEQQEIEPLVWEAQAVTVSYERARGGRRVGERADGFAVSASKTVTVTVERLYSALADATQRELWLPGAELRPRTAAPPRSARFDWGDDGTRVHATFVAKGPDKSTVTLEHSRLPDPERAEQAKAWWRARLADLKVRLEDGGDDA